jgi:hypothetical protein
LVQQFIGVGNAVIDVARAALRVEYESGRHTQHAPGTRQVGLLGGVDFDNLKPPTQLLLQAL